MPFLRWYQSQRHWLRGGLIGVAVCLALGLLNLLIYGPILTSLYGDNIPDWSLIPPLVTGHAFLLLSHFIIPYGWLCKFATPACTSWSSESIPGATPWTTEGQAGFCIQQTMMPTESCTYVSQTISFLLLAVLLLTAYFAVGAIVGVIIQKRRANDTNVH